VDARTRVGAESIIDDAQGTNVTASNVVIDGFTAQNSIVAAFTGFGIRLAPGVSGTQILNNIIQNNIVGIALANSGAQAVIRHNLIQNNNVPGPAFGQGIYTDEFVGGPTVNNVLVEENAFRSHVIAGIDVSNTDPAGGVFNLNVSTNSFDMNGRAVLLFNTHNSSFHDNSVTNSTAAASAAVRILDNNTNFSVLNNNLVNGLGRAIRLTFTGSVGTPSSGVVINENNIGVAGSLNFAFEGLLVDPGSHTTTVNAECNWWGSSTGPTDPINNPSGMGEEVVGDADYKPWLTAPAPGGPCIGGVPSGKVTGGGQVQVNIMGGKGTFGFNAKNEAGVGGSGHLNYLNHVSGAHLDCEVKLVTELTATTAKFEGTCSSKSAATSFKAEVVDGGNPGKGNDQFRISYGIVVNEGGTLTSGNIQIHKQ